MKIVFDTSKTYEENRVRVGDTLTLLEVLVLGSLEDVKNSIDLQEDMSDEKLLNILTRYGFAYDKNTDKFFLNKNANLVVAKTSGWPVFIIKPNDIEIMLDYPVKFEVNVKGQDITDSKSHIAYITKDNKTYVLAVKDSKAKFVKCDLDDLSTVKPYLFKDENTAKKITGEIVDKDLAKEIFIKSIN